MKKRKWIPGILVLFLMSMLFGMNAFAETQAVKNKYISGLTICGVDVVSYGSGGKLTGNALPKGVSYDLGTNTLTLNGCTMFGNSSGDWHGTIIRYDGSIDLNVRVLGENVFQDAFAGIEIGSGGGNLNVSGNGTIRAKNCQQIFTNDYIPTSELMTFPDKGGIYINGITVESDGCVIARANNELSISNASITQTNSKGYDCYDKGSGGFKIDSEGSKYTAMMYAISVGCGELPFVGMDEAGNPMWGEYKKAGGNLRIQNSTITLKNSKAAIKCRSYDFNGLNAYIGNGKAEKKLDGIEEGYPNSYDEKNNDKYLVLKNQGGYLQITPKTVDLNPNYSITNKTDAGQKGKITLSAKSAKAGTKIKVTAKPNSGYKLSKITVNGKKISGNSFSMPSGQAVVKAYFEKSIIKVSSVKIKGASAKLAAGKKLALSVVVSPKTATNKKVTWSTSNKKYATVTQKGVVTAKSAGAGKLVTITAKAKDGSGKKATYKIRIMKGCVKKIALKAKSSTVKVGKTTTIKALVKATSGAYKGVKYTSSNTKYATVTQKGVVKALKAGKGKKVTITAQALDGSGVKAKVVIKIK